MTISSATPREATAKALVRAAERFERTAPEVGYGHTTRSDQEIARTIRVAGDAAARATHVLERWYPDKDQLREQLTDAALGAARISRSLPRTSAPETREHLGVELAVAAEAAREAATAVSALRPQVIAVARDEAGETPLIMSLRDLTGTRTFPTFGQATDVAAALTANTRRHDTLAIVHDGRDYSLVPVDSYVDGAVRRYDLAGHARRNQRAGIDGPQIDFSHAQLHPVVAIADSGMVSMAAPAVSDPDFSRA